MSDAPSCFSMTLGQVAEACGGSVADTFAGIVATGVSTDTRLLRPGDLFVALRGANHDGHEFVENAFEAGAAGAVVSRRDAAGPGRPTVVVHDTLQALGHIAAAHRSRFDLLIAAITGSTAKTTTKNMLTAAMEGVGETLSAPGTQNNEIGVPLTLLQICAAHRFCILELAMRGVGEIDYLARVCRPSVGVITNIGDSHIGRLGSRDAIARAKAELLASLDAGGRAVLNADDFYFRLLVEMSPCPVSSFGMTDAADFHPAQVRSRGLAGTDFAMVTPDGEVPISLVVPGWHNVINALAAAAAASALGASLDQIAQGLAGYTGTPMRMERLTGMRGATVINDAYNASPDSMGAALDLLAETQGRRVLVFGDMLELGGEAEQAHREIGRYAARSGVDWLVTVGRMAALAAEEADAAGVPTDSFADVGPAIEALREGLAEGDIVLVKASRGMALERVVEAIRDDR